MPEADILDHYLVRLIEMTDKFEPVAGANVRTGC